METKRLDAATEAQVWRYIMYPISQTTPTKLSISTSLTSIISFLWPTWDFCRASPDVKGWGLEGIDDIMFSNAREILIIKKGATEAYGINFCQDHLETHKRIKSKCQSSHYPFENDKNPFNVIQYDSRCLELGNCWDCLYHYGKTPLFSWISGWILSIL